MYQSKNIKSYNIILPSILFFFLVIPLHGMNGSISTTDNASTSSTSTMSLVQQAREECDDQIFPEVLPHKEQSIMYADRVLAWFDDNTHDSRVHNADKKDIRSHSFSLNIDPYILDYGMKKLWPNKNTYEDFYSADGILVLPDAQIKLITFELTEGNDGKFYHRNFIKRKKTHVLDGYFQQPNHFYVRNKVDEERIIYEDGSNLQVWDAKNNVRCIFYKQHSTKIINMVITALNGNKVNVDMALYFLRGLNATDAKIEQEKLESVLIKATSIDHDAVYYGSDSDNDIIRLLVKLGAKNIDQALAAAIKTNQHDKKKTLRSLGAINPDKTDQSITELKHYLMDLENDFNKQKTILITLKRLLRSYPAKNKKRIWWYAGCRGSLKIARLLMTHLDYDVDDIQELMIGGTKGHHWHIIKLANDELRKLNQPHSYEDIMQLFDQ